MEQDIIEDYYRRVEAAETEANKYQKLVNNYALYRLGIFGLFILSVCLAISVDETAIIIVAVIFLSIGFGWLINKQNHFEALKIYVSITF